MTTAAATVRLPAPAAPLPPPRGTLPRAPLLLVLACAGLAAASAATPPDSAPPPAADDHRSWPGFRGPDGSGVSLHADIPLDWDGATGRGIAWKTAVPLPGVNSPIVYHDRVFLSGATAHRREVYCFHARAGQLLWRTEVCRRPPDRQRPLKVNTDTGYAAPTLTTDGRAVYAMFATGDLAALDFQGNEIWTRSFGPLDNSYGHASSLANWRGRVLVQLDQATAPQRRSRLLALDGASGHVVWQVARPLPASWCSPIVVDRASPPLIVTAGDPWVIAYAAQTGQELWRADCLAPAEVATTPIYSEGVVFAANEYAALVAIAADGRGDVTTTHVRWKADLGLPDICSPLAAGPFLLLLSSDGRLTCYDKRQGGDPLWQTDLQADFAASPALAGRHVYLFDRRGKAWILQPTRDACRHVAQPELGEACLTSPAFQDGRIYIRGSTHLFCIGQPVADSH